MKMTMMIKPLLPISKFILSQFHSVVFMNYNHAYIKKRYMYNKCIAYFIHKWYPNKCRKISLDNNGYKELYPNGIWQVDAGDYLIPLDATDFMIIKVKDSMKISEEKGSLIRYRYMYFHFYGLKHSTWNRKYSALIDYLLEKYKEESVKRERLVVTVVNSIRKEAENERSLAPVDINKIFHPMKEKLLTDIDHFYKSKDIYRECGIPYKLGILLYGPPGTGKTSLIRAIATYFNKSITQVSLSSVEEITTEWNNIYVIEELDLEIQGENDDKESSEYIVSKNKLLRLIRSIDDISEGSILFMTTNHIERIPEQILRDGRTDIKLEFKNFKDDDARQMEEIFGIHTDFSGLKNTTGSVNPAALQNYLREEKIKQIYE